MTDSIKKKDIYKSKVCQYALSFDEKEIKSQTFSSQSLSCHKICF